jgi:hypothetical protein
MRVMREFPHSDVRREGSPGIPLTTAYQLTATGVDADVDIQAVIRDRVVDEQTVIIDRPQIIFAARIIQAWSLMGMIVIIDSIILLAIWVTGAIQSL